jgi:DNA invertase Pin-like site-specific DNA recombinase
MGKMFFNILATFAEFEADLIRMRTREGMAIARAKGKLRGNSPKLSDKQQNELRRMHDTIPSAISPKCSRYRARPFTESLGGSVQPVRARARTIEVRNGGPRRAESIW